MEIDLSKFNPGNGFRVKYYIASGTWKSAFRGSAPTSLSDVALLCYHDGSARDAAQDAARLVGLDPSHPYSDYLPAFFGLFRGEDTRIWIVEELLARPLSALAPLHDVGRFVRIGRDLMRGLCCIHDQGLVHRDIKLENCGMDRYDRAKIFDLGSLVSSPGDSPCTIFTRSPDVFYQELKNETMVFTESGDIWALGATMFALRTGHYPFASSREMEQRAELNLALSTGELTRDQLKIRKQELDKLILSRATKVDAEVNLKRAVRECFGGPVAGILNTMLSFDPNVRGKTNDLMQKWVSLAESFAGPSSAPKSDLGMWPRITEILSAVVKGELTITQQHIDRLIAEWDAAKATLPVDEVPKMETLISSVKQTVERQSQRRAIA